ncbi:hypothetical protein ACBR38_02755 [Streptomyces sp. MAD19A]|nr:hypothetical protein OHA53_01455 [Streptomyces althioticus]
MSTHVTSSAVPPPGPAGAQAYPARLTSRLTDADRSFRLGQGGREPGAAP